MQRTGFVGLITMIGSLWAVLSFAGADREKLLTEPDVYGTFAAYSFDEEWAKEDEATRIAHLTVLKGVVEQHREKIAIDLYLWSGSTQRSFATHKNFWLICRAACSANT